MSCPTDHERKTYSALPVHIREDTREDTFQSTCSSSSAYKVGFDESVEVQAMDTGKTCMSTLKSTSSSNGGNGSHARQSAVAGLFSMFASKSFSKLSTIPPEKHSMKRLVSDPDDEPILRQASTESRQDQHTRASVQAGVSGLTSDIVLAWLLGLEDGDALWILRHFAEKKPHLIYRAAVLNPVQTTMESMSAFLALKAPYGSEGGENRRGVANGDLSNVLEDANIATLQFASPILFCTEDELHVDITVLRVGGDDQVCKVNYKTLDVSGKAGQRYEAASGTLVFKQNEQCKDFSIPIIAGAQWSNTQEFVVELDRDSLEKAVLGGLCQCRVMVIDNDLFPTNLYAQQIEDNRLAEVPGFGLLYEYYKFNWSHPLVKHGTNKRMLADQVHAFYFLLKMFLSVYIVDNVLDNDDNKDWLVFSNKHWNLVLIFALTLFPMGILHFVDYSKRAWKVSGTSRASLQSALLVKYLNYDDCSREQLHPSDLVMSMTRDVFNVVQFGFMTNFEIVDALSHILMIYIFQMVAPYIFGRKADLIPIFASTLYPIVLSLCVYLRMQITNDVLDRRNKLQGHLVDHVFNTDRTYQMIKDYGREAFWLQDFDDRIKDYNGGFRAANQTLENNKYMARWLTTLISALYTLQGGIRVLSGHESLGMFLAQNTILQSCGVAWSKIYDIALELNTIYPSLLRIIRLMNLPTETASRMVQNRYNKAETDKILKEDRDIDIEPIRLNNLQGFPGNVTIEQGQLIFLVGDGKSTLLKSIGGYIVPKVWKEDGSTSIFTPSHLRVLHIASQPMFFYGTLLKNLTFGVVLGDCLGAKERVIAICKRLGVSKEAIAHIESDYVPGSWEDVLPTTQCHLCNIARALVADPNVLCIHKPVTAFNEAASKRVMETLKHFVTAKGVARDEEKWHLRRSRTCVITSQQIMGAEHADSTWYVGPDAVRELQV